MNRLSLEDALVFAGESCFLRETDAVTAQRYCNSPFIIGMSSYVITKFK